MSLTRHAARTQRFFNVLGYWRNLAGNLFQSWLVVKSMHPGKPQSYWRANTALIRNLLIVWALVSLVFSILLVQPLNTLRLGSLPLGFWMAQQGSIYIFVVLIFIYAVQMDKLDRKYEIDREEKDLDR